MLAMLEAFPWRLASVRGNPEANSNVVAMLRYLVIATHVWRCLHLCGMVW